MRFFAKSLQTYLLIGLPFVIACATWQSFTPEREIAESDSGLTTFIWDVLSWNVVMWFGALVILLATILFSSSIRKEIISRIADIKDRDERDVQITANAAKNSFIASLAFMIVLLFLSVFSLSMSPIPPAQQYDGKTKQVHISMNFRLFDENPGKSDLSNTGGFNSRDFSPSASACLLALITWQLLSFRLSARKESRSE